MSIVGATAPDLRSQSKDASNNSALEAVFESLRPSQNKARARASRKQKQIAVNTFIQQGHSTEALYAAFCGLIPKRQSGPKGREEYRTLSRPERKVVIDSLAAKSSESTLDFLTPLALGKVDIHARLQAVRLLGEIGEGQSLEFVAQAFQETNSRLFAGPTVATTFRTSLTKLLGREPDGIRRLAKTTRSCTGRSQDLLIRIFARLRTREALQHLAGMLGGAKDRLILTEIAEFPSLSALRLDQRLLFKIRDGLTSKNWEVRRAAIEVLAKHRDVSSYRAIAAALEDDSPRVRRTAWTQLKSLSSVPYPADTDLWMDWLDQIENWRAEEWPTIEEMLDAEDADIVVKALKDIGRRKAYLHVIAPHLSPLLTHSDAHVRLMTCRVFQRLKSAESAFAICDVLSDSVPGVRASARDALVALTGQRHDADKSAWQQCLRSMGYPKSGSR